MAARASTASGPATKGGGLDVLLVSLGSTEGLRRADAELAGSLERAGASVDVVTARRPRSVRTLMATDLAWARAARAAALHGLARHAASPPRAIVYSSTTAALLWPRPGAIRFDAPAAGNRPGRHGLWQRPLEARRLRESALLLPWSDGGLREAPVPDGARTLVLPVAVEPSASASGERDVAAITYAANPSKKGLDRVLAAWARVRAQLPRASESPELIVAGASERELRAAGVDAGAIDGARVVGALAASEYRALLRRARVFVCAPRREDYGIAQLEALADGCLLVTTPAPGPYAALPIAAELDRRLVGEDLDEALRVALTSPAEGYAERATAALAPFSRRGVDALVARELLPSLLAGA